MDPNKLLDGLLKRANALDHLISELSPETNMLVDENDELFTLVNDAYEFMDMFGDLDDWLTKGGFLPKDWNPEEM